MRIFTCIIISFLAFCGVKSQERDILELKYYENYKKSKKNVLATLFLEEKMALYEVCLGNCNSKDKSSRQEEDVDENGNVVITMIKNDKLSFYKDIENEILLYERKLGRKAFYVKEKFDELGLNWNITNESKEILGYKAQKATTSFRGRDYEAYFTNDLPYIGGPWKFDGLPGVILEIRSLDDYISISAYSINLIDDKRINNPFKKEEFISWETMKKHINDSYRKREKYLKSNSENDDDEDTEFQIKFESVEDTGYYK